MLAGWLKGGLPAASVWVLDPNPSEWLLGQGVHLNEDLPAVPAIVLIAVKPQMMADALPGLAAMGEGQTLFLSVAAGTTIAYYESVLGLGDADHPRHAEHTRRDRARYHRDHWERDRHGGSDITWRWPRRFFQPSARWCRLEGEHQMDARDGRLRLGAGLCLPSDRNPCRSRCCRGAAGRSCPDLGQGHRRRRRKRSRRKRRRTRASCGSMSPRPVVPQQRH